LCLEEIGRDLPGEVAPGQEEVSAKEEGAEAGWEAQALELDPVGAVFALVVALGFLIK